MHGQVLLGPLAKREQKYVFGARDRADDAVQRIRTVRSARYRYIRNFMPERPFLAPHLYKDVNYPVYSVIRQFQKEGKLTPAQATLTAPRLPDEELYDVQNDPYEVNNLADSPAPEHKQALLELREALAHWITETNDKGRFVESPEVLDFWNKDAISRHGKKR